MCSSDNRASHNRERQHRRIGIAASVGLHGALFAFLFAWAVNLIDMDSGAGWAASIGISAQGGYSGNAGRMQRQAQGSDGSQNDKFIRVTMMRLPREAEIVKEFDPAERRIIPAPNMQNRVLANVPDSIPAIPRPRPQSPPPLLPDEATDETNSASPSPEEAPGLVAADDQGAPEEGGASPDNGGGGDNGASGTSGQRNGGERQGDFIPGAEVAAMLEGFTIIGTEGFYDGSTPDNSATRTTFDWQAYYAPSGEIETRFVRPAAEVPHGLVRPLHFSESGTWEIAGDLLCQRIDEVGYGTRICFEVHRKGNEIAMYYADCGALSRCYRGRLGPTGIIVRGRAFRN